MKTFVIGDIHGCHQALLECLRLSGFDKTEDRLICLGDVCDRGPKVKECIDELLTIPRCILILGNHDAWALQWGIDTKIPPEWWDQGGIHTVMSYGQTGMPEAHLRFLAQAKIYYIEHNRLFVHGGFDPSRPIEETPKDFFIWDRELLKKAREVYMTQPNHKFGPYDEVFVGHTPTINFGEREPRKFCNVWAMDTGAGWGARLTIMDVDTKQFWQANVS